MLRSLHPTGDINDFAGILSAAEKDSLEERCRKLRETTGAQLAVVFLKSLEGGHVDDFAVRLFQQWGIGEKDKANGVLLLVAIDDRKARIEVGYGLEPILPDALTGRVLDEQLFPAFKQQQYAAGVTAAVERIIQIIEKNEPAPADDEQRHLPLGAPAAVLLLSLFLAGGSFVLGAGLVRPGMRLIPQSLFFIGIPFLIGWTIAYPWAPLLHVPLGLFMAWLGWNARRGHFNRPGGRSSGDWFGTAPTWDTWDWGSSLGGSGWSGGGFSGGGGSDWGGFGGGSSGGGGASGSW